MNTTAPRLELDQNPGASTLGNDPQYGSLVGTNATGDAAIDLTRVDPLAGVQVNGAVITPQGPINDLAFLRSQYPFLPIMPFPNNYVTRVLAANVAEEVNIPNGAVLCCLQGNGDYYMSNQGNASVPAADGIQSCYKPQGYFYIGGVSSFSVVAPVAGTVVTAYFYWADQMPTY